jgi:hypothetical protein
VCGERFLASIPFGGEDMIRIVNTDIRASLLFALAATCWQATPALAQTAGSSQTAKAPAAARQEKPQPESEKAKRAEKERELQDKAQQQTEEAREQLEKAEKERAEKAHQEAEKAKGSGWQPTQTPPKSASPTFSPKGTPAPAAKGAPAPAAKVDPAVSEEQREIAKKAAHFEQVHRERTARMNRLIRIYKAKGEDAKVAKLEEMKAKEQKRTDNAMAGFRKQLGDENWGRLNAEMKRHHGRDEHAGRREESKGEKNEAKHEKERGEHAKDKAPEKPPEKTPEKKSGKSGGGR